MLTTQDLVALKAQIVAHEGLRTYLYDDATGKPVKPGDTLIGNLTGGSGYNFSANALPVDVIDLLYERRVTGILARLTAELPWTPQLSPVRVRVLVDIAYNAGFNGLLAFERMLGAAQAGDFVTAAKEVDDSRLAVGRRTQLAAMMRAG